MGASTMTVAVGRANRVPRKSANLSRARVTRKYRRLSVAEIARAILDLPEQVGSKIDAIQHATVLVALTTCLENQSAAARMLGMERKAFTRKLSRARRR